MERSNLPIGKLCLLKHYFLWTVLCWCISLMNFSCVLFKQNKTTWYATKISIHIHHTVQNIQVIHKCGGGDMCVMDIFMLVINEWMQTIGTISSKYKFKFILILYGNLTSHELCFIHCGIIWDCLYRQRHFCKALSSSMFSCAFFRCIDEIQRNLCEFFIRKSVKFGTNNGMHMAYILFLLFMEKISPWLLQHHFRIEHPSVVPPALKWEPSQFPA